MIFDGLSQKKLDLFYTQCHKSFQFFVETFWSIVVPNAYKYEPYVSGVCKHLEQWGTAFNQLIFQKCPRIGVSLISNIFFPAWYWACRDARAMFLHSSFSLDLSTSMSIKCRKLIQSPEFQLLFKHKFQLSEDLNKIDHFTNDKGGERMSCSTTSQVIGSGCWFQFCDDVVDPKQVQNAAYRNSVVEWYDEQFKTRKNPNIPIWGRCIIGARLHTEDFIGQILKREGENWHTVSLPLEANELVHSCPIWTDKRSPGQLLHSFFTPEELDGLRKRSFVLATQYNCCPVLKAGSKFSRVNFYSRSDDRFDCEGKEYWLKDMTIWISSDCAVSEKAGADQSAILKWGQTLDNNLILLDAWIGKMESPRLKKHFQNLYDAWKPQLAIVEVDGIGLPLVQEMSSTMSIKRFRSREHGDKEIRSYKFQARMEDKRIWFPKDHPLSADISNEILSFPNGKDNVIDAISQACIVLERYAKEAPVEEKVQTPEEAKKTHEDFLMKCMTYDASDCSLVVPINQKWERAKKWSRT